MDLRRVTMSFSLASGSRLIEATTRTEAAMTRSDI